MEFILFIIVGLFTGVIAGLLGVGGGIITVPALYYILRAYHFPEDHIMHICVATSLAATLFTSIGSSWAHHRRKAMMPSVLKLLVPGLLIGCVAGAVLTSFLPSAVIRILFGILAMLFAIYFFFPKLPPLRIASRPNRTLFFFGLPIGCLSTLLGVGGGIFIVPVLIGYQIALTNVIAISSAGTLATALGGSLLYLWIAKGAAALPDTIGYIHIPSFLLIGLCSLLTTSWGVHLAHELPPVLIRRIFAVALALTGFAMIVGR